MMKNDNKRRSLKDYDNFLLDERKKIRDSRKDLSDQYNLLYTNYRDDALESNASEYYNDENKRKSLGGSSENSIINNFKNLWRSINYDMDVQDVDASLEDLRQSNEEKEDIEKIQDYISLIKQRDYVRSKLETRSYTNVKEQEDDLRKFQDLQSQISDYDNYFMGEGRTHKVIADNMFNGAKIKGSDIDSIFAEKIKRGWSNKPDYGWSNLWGPAGFIAGGVEYGLGLITGAAGVAGEIVSGAYGEAKDFVKKYTEERDYNTAFINDYIRNLSKKDDDLLKRLYKGNGIASEVNIDSYLKRQHKEADRDVNTRIEDVVESQNDLKNGRLFGIDGAYDYDQVSEEWKRGREDYQNGSFWGAFIHPFYATADIASSLDMMKYQLYSKSADIVLRKLANAIVKKAPGVGTALTIADAAQGVAATAVSRDQETKLEAIGAIGNRVAREAMNGGGNLENILSKIKEDGKKMGIDTESMSVDQLWQLGVALDIQTGDEAFETAKRNAQKGINKLISANNALGVADYAEMLPYMSYWGDVTKGVTMFGERAGNKIFNDYLAKRYKTGFTNQIYKNSDKRIVEDALSNIQGPFDRMIKKASTRFVKKDMPRAALFAEHAAKYAGNKAKVLGFTGVQESLEEGVQTLLTNKYNRGEFDDYQKNTSLFDIAEFAQNPLLAMEAVEAYIGASFGAPGIDGEEVRKAMNMGFWSSIIQSGGMHALTNFTGPTEDNLRGFIRQMRDDKLAVRILADEQKKLQDFSHVDMFYDRFRKGADWNSLYTSLMDLHGMLQEGRKKDETEEQYKERMKQAHSSYAKQQFIEDDVKLMSAVWSLYSSKEINDFLKEKGINKNDENYRQFLRDGATALMDYHKTSELINDEAKAIGDAQEEHIQIAKKLLGNSASQEEKQQLISSKGKLVQTIDNLRKMYAKYLQDFPKRQQAEYDSWRADVKDAKDFYKAVGKDAIKAFGIDSDIDQTYSKEEDKAEVQANRIFNTNKNAVEKLLEQAYDNKNKQQFAKGFKKDKSSSKEDALQKKQKFVKNTVIRGLVRDQFRFEESVTPYLESIFDNDEDAANELIEKAYEASKGPKAEEDWVTDRIRMLHQLKKRQAISNALAWAKTQEQQLEKVKKLTGLDVDPSKIKGWVDFLKEREQQLLETERSYFEGGESYDEYFGDQSLEFDDEKDFKDLAEALYVNRAIQRAQGHVANAYRSLQEAPSVLRDAVFGKQAENTELDEIVNQHRSILDRMNSRSEADSRGGVDEAVDLEDMQKLSRSAAWRLIESKLKAAEKRRKIVHRQQEEDAQQRVERVLGGTQQQQEEASPVKTTGDDNVSDAEKALREQFYHEPKKKTDAEEEIRKRKKRLAEGKNSAEDEDEESQEQSEEEIKHEDVEEEQAKNESVEDDSGETAEVLDEDKTIPDDAEDVPETQQKDADSHDIEQTTNSPVEDVDGMDDGPINTENIEDIAGTGAESQNDDDKTLIDDEVQTPEDIEDMDSTFLEETDTGDIAYDGNILSDDMQDAVRDDLDTYNESQRRPVPIDETKGFDDAENTEDVVGEPGPNLIWQTLFYGYNQTDIPKIVINGKTITEFNGKPLRPGAELSKKLINPEWLRSTKQYYVVTQSQEAANIKNDKDAFTVMMVIEDKDSSYATFYRTVSEHKVSISSSLVGKDGLPKKFHTNDRENLANDLLLHNMDINKLLVAISRLDTTLYKQIVAVQKDLSAESTIDEDQKRKSKWIYNKLLVKGYKTAINFYARELFAQNYAALHITNLKAKEKAYNIWNLMAADTVVKMPGENDVEFEARKAKYAADRDQFELIARKYYSKQGRTIFSGQQIEAEIDKLKSTRDEIIDAYLEKNGKDYIFPETAQIGKVEPQIVSQSNGRINSQKTPGGLPIFRNVVDESLSMTEVQDQLENEDLLIGIGKGLRASKTKPDGTKVRPIVKWGFSRQDAEQEELYEDGGCSGKIYLMVPGINGKPVPVMLGEEKFNVQHRVRKDGSTEEVPINNSRRVELCIDPLSKELLGGKNVKPSAAEVLLYMILGEVNIPGLISGQLRDRDRGNITDLVALFINADPKTLLKKQPTPGDELMQVLASKQLYYGTTVNKVVKKTESGKNVTTTEAEEGVMYFHIGMKTTKEVEIPDGKGGTIKQNVETYQVEKYTKEQILSTGTETESAEDLRQRIVQAIATQMHWNTDDFTFGESASMDASKTILGRLVEALMNQAFKDGKFNGMSLQQILDYKVSIMDCPQLSFRIGDFYEAPEGAKTLGDLKFARGSVLAWMFKTGHLKTDLGNTPFKDPFVFGHGVKKTGPQKGSKALGQQTGAPIQPVDQEVSNEDTSRNASGENPFYDKKKEEGIVSRLSSFKGMKKSGINLPKTLEEAKEKLKKWTEFLLGPNAKTKKFADRIDIEKNDMLAFVLLSERTVEDVCKYSTKDGDIGISEEDEEGLNEWNDKLRNSQIDGVINTWNSTNSEKISKENIKREVLKDFEKQKNGEVEAVFIYREKSSGKIKVLVDTISGDAVSDKKPIKPEELHYFSKAATGVYSKHKTRGEFEEKKAREWLSNVLGIDQANVVVWDAAKNAHIDDETYGEVNAVVNSLTGELIGKIGLSRQGGASVHYHEAWHYVNLLMLSRREREQLYKAYKDSHPFFKRKNPTNEEVEERMAEDFRKWVLLNEDTSYKGKVKRFFQDLLDFLRIFILVPQKSAYRKQFAKIVAGDYRQSKVSQENLRYFKQEWKNGAKSVSYHIPGVTEEQRVAKKGVSDEEQKGFIYISNHQEYFDASQAIAKKVVQNAKITTAKDVKKQNKRDYKEIVQELNDWINNSTDLTGDDKNLLRDVMKNEDLVKRAITEAFEELGLTAKIRTLKDYRNKDKKEQEKTIEKADVEDGEFRPDNTWDRFDLAFSKKDNAAIRAKLFMKQIPVLRRVIKKDGTEGEPEEVRDRFGLIETYSFKEAWNLIVENLWQCESIDDRNKDGYKPTSLMGMIEAKRKSNVFYESLYRQLNSISGAQWKDIELRSQIFSTINSNKPQVSYLRIDDPLQRKDYGDDLEDSSFDDSEIVRNGVVADIERTWSIHNDNEEEVARNLPRDWSRALTAHGLIEVNKDGKSVISKGYATRLSGILKDVKKDIQKLSDKTTNKKLDATLDKVISFYNEMAIPLDKDSLYVLFQMSVKGEVTDSKIIDLLKDWFVNEEQTSEGDVKQNSLAKMAQSIITAANNGSTTVKYGGDNRERELDQLYANFGKNHHIYKLAVAINTVHPSSREFSIKGPNGERIYPVSQNSFVSDRTRKLSTSGKEFAESMTNVSEYCKNSLLLDIAGSYTKPLDQETHFKLNAFVGIKDTNRKKGADYFGITPMEDYIAKMIMTEKDQIILPTMADKKTWYSLSHKNLHLVHDAILVMPYKDVLTARIYEEYEKDHEMPEDYQNRWKSQAEEWYHNLDSNSEIKQRIDKLATDDYVKLNKDIQIQRYSENTLNIFGKYMMSEINALIDYYSEQNIDLFVNKRPQMLTENYYGKIIETSTGQKRLDMSGNGGKFRYFHEAITFTDSNNVVYNLNQRLQYLWELQRKIESGQIKNIKEDDPLYPYVGQLAISDKDNLDGFELIRQELRRIKDLHFQQDTFISEEIKTNINSILISLTKQELDRLSEPNSPYKMVKKQNGMYLPEGIPAQLIRRYAKSISKALGGEEVTIATTQGADRYLMQDALFSLIASYVANSAISTIEFEKVFSGDPAFYKRSTVEKTQRVKNKSSLPKKGKTGVVYITDNNEAVYIYDGNQYKPIKDLSGYGVERISTTMQMKDGSVVKQDIIVDDVYDTFSDKIKRLGSTLSPGDEMRLHYTPEELEKYKELSITDYTNVNVEDINAQSVFADHIRINFKKQLLIDHIRAIDPEKFKKYCEKNGLDFEKSIAKIYNNSDFFNEIYNLYSEIHNKVDKELAQQVDPYDGITVSDAQVFVRPELYRKIRIGLGQWTYDDERAYRIIESDDSGEWLADEKKYEAVRKLEIFPLKMSYFQNDPQVLYKDGNQDKGRVVPMLNKMAVFPLFKFQATSDTGKKLYDRMNKSGNELDMISFKSAVKVGASQNGVKMSKDDASVEDQICSIDDLFYNDSNQSIDYRKQISKAVKGEDGKQKVDEKGKPIFEKVPNPNYGQQKYRHTPSAIPVQIQKLELLRMQLNTSAHKDESRNIGTQMFKLAFSNIVDDAEYGGKKGWEIKKDIIRIINDLTDIGVASVKQEFFTNGQPDQEKIKNYIRTIIENNGLGASAEEIIGSGVAASIASRRVFENSVTKVVESEVVDIETTGGSAIQQSVFGFVGKGNKDVKSQTGAYKINYNNGEELSWNLENGSMEVLLSMNFFKQVMPDDIKKKAFTEQKQWLIDRDFIKGTKTDGSKSDPKPFGVGYRIPTQGLSSMFAFTVADVMPESVGDLIIVPREFTAQTGSDFDVDKLYLATFAYKDGEYITEESDGKTKKSLSNQLLENYINLITDEKNYANARASIDVLTNKLKKDFVKGVIRSGNRGYIPSLYELTPSFQVDRKREFSIGKEGIAPFALNVTNLSLTQMCHLTMRYEGNVADYEFGALDQIYGKDGRRIADWLSAMVNAHVDVAKDPYIFDLNVNHATYNYANFLIRAGMGMSTFTFLSQQSLKNIADEINNAGGIYGGNIDGSKPESEIYKKRKSQAIRNEFSNILKRLIALENDYTNLKTKDIPKSQLEKLQSLIEYAKYMSLTDKQKSDKYKDDNVPELKYSRKSVFDENEGIKAIENGRKGDLSSLIDYYEFQLASVRCFKEIANHAQGISSLVSASQIDTKKFGNTIKEHINFRNKIDHMYEDSDVLWTINEEGFDQQFINKQGNVDKSKAQQEAMRRYFEESYLEHKFDEATKLVKQILSQQLFSGTQQYEDIFKEIFCQINGKRQKSGIYEKELSADKIDAMGDAIDNMMRFNALFNVGSKIIETLPEGTYDFTMGGNKKNVIAKWQELLFGSETKKPLYERLDQFKRNLSDPEKAEEYWDITDAQGKVHNDLLDILIPQSPNNKCSIGKITLAQSLIDKDSQAKRKLISSFAQLLASEVDEVRELAEDLMFYAYYSQYDQNTINSFFDLVPVPYRKQYDESISKALADLNSSDESVKSMAEQDVYDDEGTNKIIDVICRNYWYDDQIVPRYFIKDWAKSSFQYSNVIGRMERYGSNWGFPRFIAFTQDDAVKGNKYFKVRIGNDTLLYRKVGEVKRIGKKDGKPASTLKIFVPIPKAGLHQDGTHQFEFYADYKTPSVFKDNRITSNFSHEMIRDDVDKMIESSNKSNGEYVCEVIWDDSSIPEAYDKMNRQTYEPLKESAYEESLTRVTLHAPQEYGDHKFKDPEQVGIKAANVVLDITSDGKTSIEYEGESDNKRRQLVDPKYKDKVSVLNVNNGTISDEQYNKIKQRLLEEGSINRIYVKADYKSGIEVTDKDVDNYLQIIGVDSQRAKYLSENSDRLQYAVRQYKINTFLYNIIKRLREDGITGVYLDCSHYYTTTAAEAVQFCKLADNEIRAHIHVSFYSRFKNPKKYWELKKTLNHRKEDFVLQDPEEFAETVKEAAEQQEKAEEKAKKIVEDVLEEAESGFDLSAKLKRPVDKDMDKEKENQAPPMIRQAENTPQDQAKNRACTGDESNDIFD